MNDMRISGGLPPLPAGLERLKIEDNPYLTCSLPAQLPETMIDLIAGDTACHGRLPQRLPSKLEELKIGDAFFDGPVPPLPVTLSELRLNDNRLTGVLDLSKLSHLTDCKICTKRFFFLFFKQNQYSKYLFFQKR